MAGAILAAAANGITGTGLSGGIATVNSPVSGVIPGSGSCTTSAAVVTALGSYTPDSYVWTQVDGDEGWAINADPNPANASSATFTYAGLLNGDIQMAEFKCVVTDGAATTDLYVVAIVRSTSTL